MGKPMIHPSRFAAASRTSGYRVVDAAAPRPGRQYPCVARVSWPTDSGGRRDADGRLDFDGDSWTDVTGSALMFARRSDPHARRFGAKYPQDEGFFRWWDDTTTSDNILTREDAADYVREWLEHLFPSAAGAIDVHER